MYGRLVLPWKDPLDLEDDSTRQLLAREFAAELRRVGAATRQEMHAANLSLLRVPAEEAELIQLTELARRLGWVQLRDTGEKNDHRQEWVLTETGRAVRPPETLHLSQVVARVLRFADPVRKGAAEWLPLVAVAVGAVAATQQAGTHNDDKTLIAVRVLSIAVLLVAVARGGIGERELVKAAKAFPRVQKVSFYEPIKAFHAWPRLVWVAIFDAAVLTAFGMAIFLTWWGVVPAVVVAAFVFVLVQIHWRRPARDVARKRPPTVLESFVRRKTALLTSYRRDGTPIDTPLTIAVEGDSAFIRTYDKAGKAKRMANNPNVRLAPSTVGGKPVGAAICARSRLLDDQEAAHAARAVVWRQPIVQGLLVPLMHWLMRYRTLHYELTPVDGTGRD